MSDTAVSAFSPPLISSIAPRRLPGGCAMISTPVSSMSSGLVSLSSACPPPNSCGKICLKRALPPSRRSRGTGACSRGSSAGSPSRAARARSRGPASARQVLVARALLLVLLDRGEVDLAPCARADGRAPPCARGPARQGARGHGSRRDCGADRHGGAPRTARAGARATSTARAPSASARSHCRGRLRYARAAT